MFEEFWQVNTKNNLLYFVVGAIVIVYLTKSIVSKSIANLLIFTINKTSFKLNKQLFTQYLVIPVQRFVFWLIVILLLDKLHLPISMANISLIGNITLGKTIHFISTAIFVYVLCRLLMSLVDYVATILEAKANITETNNDNQLIIFFKDFLKIIIIVNTFLLIIEFGLKQDIGNLLAGLSIVGAAIALAAKESLENLIASFIIFFDKPFTTGDDVKVQQITGVVEKIGLRSTRIRSGEKTFVTVPNKMMVDSIIDNQTQRTKRRAVINLEMDPKTKSSNIANFKSVMLLFLKAQPQIIDYRVNFTDFAKNSLLLKVEIFLDADLDYEAFLEQKETVNIKILEELEKNGIAIAGNSI